MNNTSTIKKANEPIGSSLFSNENFKRLSIKKSSSKKNSLLVFILMMITSLFYSSSYGQSNPSPFNISSNWTLGGWATTVASGSYPGNGATGADNTTGVVVGATNANMVFWKMNATDPTITATPSTDYSGVYTGGNGTITGNGTSGFLFDNTGGASIGAACLSINTTGRNNIQVAWTCRTTVVGARNYGIRLRYRVGTTGAFTDASGTLASIDYTGWAAVGSQTFAAVTLPIAAENQSVVQVIWQYYYFNAVTGTRPKMGVDDITVSSSSAAATLTPSPASLSGLSYVLGSGPSTASSFTLSASNLTAGGGTITINTSPSATDFEVSTTSSTTGFGTSATLSYTGTGTISSNTVYVRLKAGLTAGNYPASSTESLSISGGTGTASVNVSGSVSAGSPSITLDQTGITQQTVGNVTQGTTNNILSNFHIGVTTANTAVTGLTYTAGGTFTTNDITNFKLYANTTATFPGGSPLSTVVATGIANGGSVTFSSFSQPCNIGDTYFWITADIAAAGIVGHTVSVPVLANGAFTFASGSFSGSSTITASGAQTIQSSGYFWNGGNIAATPAAGGTGTWGTTNAWRQPSASGAQATWANSNPAIFAGTAGTVTLDATRVATSFNFNTDGYIITTSATQTLTGPIVLANNVGLTFTPSGTVNIGSVSGSGTAALTVAGLQSGIASYRMNLATASSVVSVPTTISSLGGTGTGATAGYVATATGTSLSSAATITNNTTIKTVIGATSGNDITVNSAISGSADLMFAAGTSGGAGTVTLNAANNYTGATYFNAANSGIIKSGITNALPTTTDVTMGSIASNGGIFDLFGFNQTIGSLTSSAGGGLIRNNGANDAVLTVSGSANPPAMALPITDGTKKIALVRSGTGSLTLSGVNTYTGGTTITSGSLILGAAGTLASTGTLTLGGGTFSTGATTGFTQTLGTLTLNAGSSTISLGTGSHTLTFANSSAISWSGTLTINGWTGSGGVSGTAGKIVVGVGGLTGSQLSSITFTGYPGTPIILGTGELVPAAPAPAVINSSLTANSTYGVASSYTITATNSPSSYGATGLPTGMTFSGNIITIAATTAAGTYNIGISATNGGGTDNKTLVYTVNKTTITITADNQTVSYGDAIPTYTYTPSGFVNSENSSVISGTPSFSCSYTTSTPVASSPVTITPSLGTLAATNYIFTMANGSVIINKANQTITFTALMDRTVGDANFNLTATASSGLPVSYSSGNSSVASISGIAVTVGAAGDAIITASQTGDGNYNAATSVNQNQHVNAFVQTPQTITFTLASTATYGDAPITLNGVATSGLTVQYVSSDATVASVSGNVLTILKPGTAAITASQPGNVTYADAFPTVSQTITISPKTLIVSGSSASSKTYDRFNTATITGTLTGVVTPDVVTLNLSGTFPFANIGTGLTVTSTSTITGTDASKYTLTQPTGLIADITAKALTITSAAATSKVYDGTQSATITGTLSGVISPDVVTLVGTGLFATSTVGTGIAVTSTSTLSGANAGNYSLTQPTGLTADITPLVNLVIERVGNSTSLTSAAVPVSLVKYSTSGSLQGTFTFPSTGTPSNAPYNLVETGSGTSDGYIGRSSDLTYIVVPGYNAPTGTATIASAGGIGRTIGKYFPDGTIQTNGTFNTLAGNNYRSIASNGNGYWLSGASGTVYTPTDATTGTSATATTVFGGNTRATVIFNNTLFTSTASASYNGTGSNFGIYQLGSFNTLPTSTVTSGTAINLINEAATGSPYGFAFSPNGLILYVADDRATSAGGIQRYDYVGGTFSTATGWSGGSWNLTYTLGTGATNIGARAVTVDFSGTNNVIYATTAEATLNRFIKITDTGAGSTATTLATATANNIFRGISFGPIPATVPSVAIAAAHPATGTINRNTADNIIGAISCAVTNADITLTGVTVTTAGTYSSGDLSNIKFWLSNSATSIVGATQLGTTQSSSSVGDVSVSGLSSVIATGTTGYILVTASVTGTAVAGHTINLSTTSFSNITFAAGTKTGTNPVAAGNVQTITALTSSIAISNASPAAGTINQNTTNNTISATQLTVTSASTILNSFTATTGGSYITSDFQANGFKVWLSNNATSIAGATQLGTAQAIVASGGTISVTGLTQSIGIGTSYILITADVSYNASPSRNININSNPFSNISFASGTTTGTDPVSAGNIQTFGAVTPSIVVTELAPTSGNVAFPSSNNILYELSFAVTGNSADLNGLQVTTSGTYSASDFTNNTIKLWYSTSNNFGTALQIGTSQTMVASGSNINFTGLSKTISLGTTGYVWITGNLPTTSVAGNNFNIAATSFSNISFSQGTESGSASAGGVLTFVHGPYISEILLPQYAVNGALANDRLQYLCRLQLNYLTPNTTYRYFTGASTSATITTSSAPGNYFAINNSNNATYGHIVGYSSSKSMGGTELTGDLFSTAASYSLLTTDANGAYSGWFSMVPTGNAVFNDGAQDYFYVQLNDGNNGTAISQSLRTTNTFTMIDPNALDAQAISGTSNASSENPIFIYDDITGSSRPLYGTWAENDGIAEAFNDWYSTPGTVNGVAGAWGAYVPSNASVSLGVNVNGIQRIEQRDVVTGNIKGCPATAVNGQWPDAGDTQNNLFAGFSPVVFDLNDAPLDGKTLTASAGSNGTISPNGATVVNCGDNLTYTITPNNCYHIADVLVDGVSDAGAIANGTYTFNSISANHTINATFATNAPTIVSVGNINVNNDLGVCGANITYAQLLAQTGSVTGTPLPTVTFSPAAGVFAVGTTLVTATATNICGTATATFNVVVIDNEAPATPVLADVTGECTATATTATTTDNCAGSVTGTTTDALTYSTQGLHVIHWTFADGNGNTSTANQNVIVHDVTAPVVPVLADVTGECTATATTATTTDNCAGSVTGTTSDALTYTTQGTHIITWSFSDGNGNISTATQNVIVHDVTAPVVPVLADVTGECTATATTATTTDNCVGSVTGTTSDALTYTTQGTHIIHWSFSDGNGNISTANQNVIVHDVTAPTIIAPSDITVCSLTPATISSLGTPIGADNCGTVTFTNNHPSTTYPFGTTVVTWTADDGHGNTTTATQNVVVNKTPTGSVSLGGSNPNYQVICNGSSSFVPLTSTVSGTTFAWTAAVTTGVVTGAQSGSGVTIQDILTNASTVHGVVTYVITPTSPAGCVGATFVDSVRVGTIPSTPVGFVTTGGLSPSVVCTLVPANTATYKINAVPEATGYTWTVPTGVTGMTITSGQGTSQITCNVSAGTVIGYVTVRATNACGSSASIDSLYITKKPQTPGTISGSTSLCGQTSATFTVAPVFGATSYAWSLPAGITANGSATGNTINVNIASTFVSGSLSVSGVNNCGSVPGTPITLTGNAPATPISVTGPTGICGLTTATFTVGTMPGASSYVWTVPAGVTITSTPVSAATITIAISGYTSGNITVASHNACGTSAAKVVTLTTAIAAPGTPSGPVGICGLTTGSYSIAAVTGATSYNWTVPSGVTITSNTGTNIHVAYGTSNGGTVAVSASNACATSAATGLAIQKISAAGTITGAASVCGGGSFTYSITAVSGATGYNWVVPAGWVITSGQNTTSVTATVPVGTLPAGIVKVAVVNSCGTSNYVSKAISACASGITINNTVETKSDMFSTLYPNPTSSEFTIDVTTEMGKEVIVEVYDVLGNLLIHEKHEVVSGTSTMRTNIESYKNGIYFVRLLDTDNNTISTQRVVKQ